MNSFMIAFAMYSKIPMPQREWTEDNMKYAMCFFPLVGLVIGILEVLFFSLGELFFSGIIFRTSIMIIIPILVTGGIHADGLIDTIDAKCSWGDQEKRRAILKDPHVGAFGVIGCVMYYFMLFGAYCEITQKNLWLIAIGFVYSRALSGLASVLFPLSKENGLLADFAKRAQKKKVCIIMYMYIILCTIAMILINPVTGSICIVSGIGTFFYYRRFARKKFGGNSGDLAGYFLQICELVLVIAAVLCDRVVYFL